MFDRLAPFYGPAMKIAGVTHEDAVRLLAPQPSDLIADVGGGTGIGAAAAVRLYGCRALIVDRSLPMLHRAARSAPITLVAADAVHLPLREASVDGALCLDALHHMSPPAVALREMLRVLKPGGRLVIEELNGASPLIRLLGYIERLLGERVTITSPAALAALVERAGFVVEGLRVIGFATLLLAARPGLRG